MELNHYSISQIRDLIKRKKISPKEVYSFFLKRIKKYNPKINAFLTVVEKPQIDKKKETQPLFGIPFSMKDTYLTKGIRTTAGSKVLENYLPQYNATVYQRLKDTGAVLIGKTNCDAWGHGSSTENSDFGVVKNPWNDDYVAGGSSGGSAAGVAAGMTLFDIGEDTGGSIRLPASFCSVVGLKVTYGRVSRYGCIAFASSLDTVGPITRSVEDCALVMEVIAGRDPFDATTGTDRPPQYSQLLGKNVKGMTLGTAKEYFVKEVDQEVKESLEESIKVFKKLGIKIKEVSLPMTQYSIPVYYLIAPSETSANLARYDGIRYGGKRSLFGAEAKRRVILGTYTLSAGYYDDYYLKATKVRTLIREEFENALKEVDAILAPVSPTPPFRIGEKANNPLEMYLADIFTVPVNLAGIPSLAIPSGFSKKGLPIGMQIIGRHFDEATILNLGYQYEKEVGGFPVLKR